MENKRLNKGLVTLLAVGAIAITSVLSGCKDIYQRIDNSNYSCEDKEQRKIIAIDFNEDIDANRIDPNNVSDEDIDYMYKIMRLKYGD